MGLLYLDSSSFLTFLLQQGQHVAIARLLRKHLDAGGAVGASRLLWLEARRVAIREALLGNDIGAIVAEHLKGLTALPVTEQVWQRAAEIEQHVRTLDAIHLATCELAGATLLAVGLDAGIHRAAKQRGTALLPAA